MTTFEKQNLNQEVMTKEYFHSLFVEMGFKPLKIEVSYTNGCSAYIDLSVNVVNENKMPRELFVFEGKAGLTIRVSDHASNLEKICGGSSGDKMSFDLFKSLVNDGFISKN